MNTKHRNKNVKTSYEIHYQINTQIKACTTGNRQIYTLKVIELVLETTTVLYYTSHK